MRYLGSEFLGHATAADLLTQFKDGITIRQLDPKRLLQVSMDGPSVNWKFYTDLARERKKQELPKFLNIGSWKQFKLSWKSHGIVLSDFCGNPEFIQLYK